MIPFLNSGFEDELAGWTIDKTRGGEIRVVDVDFPGSRRALQIKATAVNNGARIDGPRVACAAKGLIEFYGSIRSVSGRALGLWVYHLDADGNVLPEEFWTCIEAQDGVWHRNELLGVITPHPQAAFLQVTLIAYPPDGEVVEAYVDDFRFVVPALRIPPAPSQFKGPLTPADVIGPDGVVYPNWKNVGVQGGIPDVPLALELTSAKPETDIAGLLEESCRQVGERGGGAIVLGAGTYCLDRPVTIRHNGIVLRGAGRDKTRLVFRYAAVPERDIGSVLTFQGAMEEQEHRLAEDGKRGDTTLVLESGHDLKAGDKVVLRAPDTPRWLALVNHRATPAVDVTHAYHIWGRRVNTYAIASVNGNAITISQPLRIDFPVADGSHLRRIRPVEGCGIEDLAIRHESRQEYHTVTSRHAWNCWVRRVDGIDCGRSGVHFQAAKWCEVRDCTFTGFDPAVHIAHTNWGGYAGFTQAADCLMDNTVWHRFRHGPIVQFGAQGNVIRNSVFDGSDAQWHAGWSTENLFENCVIDAHGAYGSYGYGAYATGSYDGGHGPNGPRNVVYNCDFKSPREGVMACGINEGWLLLHNRFEVDKGAGFVGLCGAFDHVIRHNTFILKESGWPMVALKTADCVGVELSDNTLVGGNGTIYEGLPALAVERGNRVRPLAGTIPARPVANPPSIFEWQQTQAGKEHR